MLWFNEIDVALWVMWAFAIGAVAALTLRVPRLVGRVRRGDATTPDRVALSVLAVSAVWAAAMLSMPFSEGPYRCSPVATGAEGRQTVYPDDAPRRTGDLVLLQRREQVCDDAAKARGVTSAVAVGSGLLICAGIGLVWRDRTAPAPTRPDAMHRLDA